tara:strand:- start:376 stop:615 length:240 start_codon:yes stop_codon:yes gene_type:complete
MKIDMVVNGYRFTILDDIDTGYSILHYGVYSEGVRFAKNTRFDSLDEVYQELKYFTKNPNVFQIKKETKKSLTRTQKVS